ncbi:MAG: TRAP transporter small permease [Hyphomicrobiaceae bacterium]
MIRGLLTIIDRIEKIGAVIASLFMFSIMVIVFSDVAMRYAFNKPFAWAYDLISLYLMAGLFYFILSSTYAASAHIGVDILYDALPTGVKRAVDIVINGISSVIFFLIAYVGLVRAAEAFHTGDVLSGAIPWPMWPAFALVPLGAGLLALRLVLHMLASAYNFFAGADVIALPSRQSHSESYE